MANSSPLFHSAQEDLSSGDEDVTSSQLGDDEYEIAGILCERKALPTDRDHLARYYLVEWKGYPIYWQATWEPGNNIPPDTLAAWKVKKKEMQKKGEPEFDWKRWQKGYEADLIAHPETYPYVWAVETEKEDATPEPPAASVEPDRPSMVLKLKMPKKPATSAYKAPAPPAAPPATVNPPTASSKSKKLAAPAAKPSALKATDEISSRASFAQAQPAKGSTMTSAPKKSVATTAQLPVPRPKEKTLSMALDAPAASTGPAGGLELESSLKKRVATGAPPQAPDAKIIKKSLFSTLATSAASMNRPALTSLAQRAALSGRVTNVQQVFKKPLTQSVTSKAPDPAVVSAKSVGQHVISAMSKKQAAPITSLRTGKPVNESLLKSSITSAEAAGPVGGLAPSSISKPLAAPPAPVEVQLLSSKAANKSSLKAPANSFASVEPASKPKLSSAPTKTAASVLASKTSSGFSIGSFLADMKEAAKEAEIHAAQPLASALSSAVQTASSPTGQPEVAVLSLGPQVKPLKTANGKTGEEAVYNLSYGPQVRDVGLIKLHYSRYSTEKRILKELLEARPSGMKENNPLPLHVTKFLSFYHLTRFFGHQKGALQPPDTILDLVYVQEEAAAGAQFRESILAMGGVGVILLPEVTLMVFAGSGEPLHTTFGLWSMPVPKSGLRMAVYPPIKKGSVETFWYQEVRLSKAPGTYRTKLVEKVWDLPLIKARQKFSVVASDETLEGVELRDCLSSRGAIDTHDDLNAATLVFIHRLLLPQLHLLPHLTSLKSRPQTQFYLFGTAFALDLIITDGGDHITKNAKYQATSIFPHGGVIVMTSEMIINSPNIVEFVLGYAEYGGWNVMVCPGLITEVEAFCHQGLTGESDEAGKEFGDVLLTILAIKEALDKKRVVEFVLLEERETICQSLLASLRLYQVWSCETYRRFIVLHSVKDDTEQEWTQGIEVHTPDQFLKMKAVADSRAGELQRR
ncbi:hypothetical protein SAICODRAFT_7423 [Saitoella complicata NRRL Y-17804]|uniref:Chromo domain-containing protein n=1 Tax=Saitoella complicata (strain BCRC 22490 / CBS 7301 / JCM 7358 / NBRC 10748 / NRRL Y-17804) TaxID=698492 RepID=A0A0E9N9E3_SAICN|nr:uncharacterized protein SAICODRAFT_7423 [Saitoella complicata NRRL Y-17804]ODQ53277.1 hypothetical protein SAICODRAFT_7423 [Saitoella complicata NRRL Y-17804]GAO46403.1 hypothetical protein G7K_0634-t1 [Saitoella complicata NRRL Y-17804]